MQHGVILLYQPYAPDVAKANAHFVPNPAQMDNLVQNLSKRVEERVKWKMCLLRK